MQAFHKQYGITVCVVSNTMLLHTCNVHTTYYDERLQTRFIIPGMKWVTHDTVITRRKGLSPMGCITIYM